jgi:Undecaprenyl-phosphate galactose phosphotransferase WbaP
MSAVAAPAILPKIAEVPRKTWIKSVLMLSSDFAALLCVSAVCCGAFHCGKSLSLINHCLPLIALLIGILWLTDLYSEVAFNPVHEFRKLLAAAAVVFSCMGAFIFPANAVGRAAVIASGACSVILMLSLRACVRWACASRSWWSTPAILLGAGQSGSAIAGILHDHPEIGLNVVAVLDANSANFKNEFWRHRGIAWGELDMAPELRRQHGIPYAIVAAADMRRSEVNSLSGFLEGFEHVLVIPDDLGLSSLWVSAKDVGGLLGLEVRQNLSRPLPRLLKRSFDILVTGSALLLLAPLFALLYLAIRLTSNGPGLYGHRRIGRSERHFSAWKFRSMVMNADQVLARAFEQNPALREAWSRDFKLRDDPRITPLGKWLRKSSLDELPQLWNVLRGYMSLVGPRPIVRNEIPKYGDTFSAYCRVRPGITGLWQVSGRNRTTYDERVQFDDYYVRNWSIWLDLYILLKTVRAVVAGDGAC